ncbi:hypothetical protein HanOQP8_Chr14g0548731 [Helianthus annuus]|nr:hypothetical protein HanOQP8_Chr14g0548731 [Helianthus annuus]
MARNARRGKHYQVSPSNPKSPKIHKLKPLICSKSSFKHELVIISLRGSKGMQNCGILLHLEF